MPLLRLLPRFRRAERSLVHLRAREGWTRAAIDAYQLERLNRLWAHARVHVPYYRRLSVAERLPEQFSSKAAFVAEMPRLRRELVRDRPELLLSDRRDPGRWRLTGGSTGSVARLYESHATHHETLRAKYRMLDEWGIGIFDRSAHVWGYGHRHSNGLAGRCDRVIEASTDLLRQRLRVSAYELDSARLQDALLRMRRFRPVVLYGFATAVQLLAREAAVSGWSCDSLRLVVLTSEPTPAALVEEVSSAFRATAVVEYGMTECEFIAGEGPDRSMRVREDTVILESAKRGDGYCDLLLTVLGNPSFPLIRYETGDVTDRPIDEGHAGFAVLNRVCGRADDIIVTADGRLVHPAQLHEIFEHDQYAAVRRYRVHQLRDGAIDVVVELDRRRPVPDLGRMAHALRAVLAGGRVSVKSVDQVPQTVAGKHQTVTSDYGKPAAPPSSAA